VCKRDVIIRNLLCNYGGSSSRLGRFETQELLLQFKVKNKTFTLWILTYYYKVYRKSLRPRIFYITLKEENEVGGLMLLNFKTYYKDKAIKVWAKK